MLCRRKFLQAAAVLAGVPLAVSLSPLVAAAQKATVQEPQPFDYAWLKGQARALASSLYQPPLRRLPPMLAKLDYDHYQAIRSRLTHGLWISEELAFRVQFFPLGFLFHDL